MVEERDPMCDSIKRLREGAGMTQPQLAEKLEVHANTVCSWETGSTEPRGSQLAAMARLFGVSVEAVMGLPEAG